MVDCWKCLDVAAQRWSALEFVLQKQAEEPEVKSRRPLWDLKHPDDPDWRHE